MALSLFAREASAHVPPVAWLMTPDGVGIVADREFTIAWFDTDLPSPTATVTFNLFYTPEDPPTFPVGTRPATLTGTPIVRGILERDPTNAYRWDTSSVPPGTYRIYSTATENPPHVGPTDFAPLSLGLLTIAHPGDALGPAVIFTTPATEYVRADRRVAVPYAAFDPDHSAVVKLEATADGVAYTTLAEGLPAVSQGSYSWRTAELPEADWSLRATITDGRGRSFVAYSEYYVVVLHLPGATDEDAGIPDATADAGVRDATLADAGTSIAPSSCAAAPGSLSPLLLLSLFLRRGRRRSFEVQPKS